MRYPDLFGRWWGKPRNRPAGPLGSQHSWPRKEPMSMRKTDRSAWTRRDFMRATGGALALGAFAHPSTLPAFAADSVSNLDDLARSVRGRLLRERSLGYDEARKVWNLAYDRRPLAMVRAADVDDVRRCVEVARTHAVPVALRSGG